MSNKVILTVQIYLEKDNKYLMLYRNKKKNDMNGGKWIGVGGHVEQGETPLEAVKREVKEETGLTLNSAIYRAIINFVNDDYVEIIYQYTSSDFTGEVIDCNEGELRWIDKSEVLTLPMWEGDKYFLDPLIKNEPFFEITIVYKNNKFVLVNKK